MYEELERKNKPKNVIEQEIEINQIHVQNDVHDSYVR